MTSPVPLTADLIEAFAGVFLSPMYDNPRPTPDFHREGWALYASDHELCSIVAPREHAKSTAFTHDYLLACLLFRVESFALIVSATEKLAMEHLGDVAKVFRENDEVRRHFGVEALSTDAKTEITVRFTDGYECRVLTRSAEQKVRGLKWNGRRPGLIICDDMEEDEQVENPERRAKFRRWINRALLPCMRRGGKIRAHGTILHEDSWLARIHKRQVDAKQVWHTLFYKAHAGFDDFSEILWPEQFPEERLRQIRQRYINDHDAAGYAQEYLNDPIDSTDAYLRKEWFTPMRDEDFEAPKIMAAAADFAISKGDKANRTSLTAGGMDQENILHYLGQVVGRWDALELVEEIFTFAARWKPDVFWVEDGQVWLAIWPLLQREMQRRGTWINFVPRRPVKDKASRGRSLQRRMRAGGTRWDTEAWWFSGMQQEMLRFTGVNDATLDDQFDSAALLSLGFDDMSLLDAEDFVSEEEQRMRRHDPRQSLGRNRVTGY